MTEGPSGDQPPDGRLRPTGPAAVAGPLMLGLVLGWLLHPVADRVGNPPVVSWLQSLTLLFVAIVLGTLALLTHRTIHVHREYLEPRRAVNRLLLARACILVGGLVAGGYLGYAVSWLGVPTELGEQRLLRSAAAGLAAAGIVVAALFLERACRIRSDDDDT